MAISTVTASQAGYTTTSTTQTQSGAELGQSEFLTLLITQLQHQDPLNPMDSADFTAQLAQFNSLEQLLKVNEKLDSLYGSQRTMNNGQAVGYIGKTIQAEGNTIRVADGEAESLVFDLAADAASAYVTVYDSLGSYVTTLQKADLNSGENVVEWDGTAISGARVTDGWYTYSVTAMAADETTITATPYLTATVTGIGYRDGAAVLLADGREIDLSSIVRVNGAEN